VTCHYGHINRFCYLLTYCANLFDVLIGTCLTSKFLFYADTRMTEVKLALRVLYVSLQICEADEKLNYLVGFLRRHRQQKHLVFFSTCGAVDYFSKLLQR